MPSTLIKHPCEAEEAHARLLRSGLLNAAGGLLLLSLLALLMADRLGLSGWAVVKSLAVYLITLGWLLRHLSGHRPHARLFPANQVTLARLLLTALLAGWIGEPLAPALWTPALIAGVILALDGLDGWLARRGGWASAFGARFDMETDALLVLVLTALAWSLDKAGPWVIWAGLTRYLFLGGTRLWPWLGRPLPASRRRQTLCVLLVVALLLALLPPLRPPVSLLLASAGLTLVSYSFAVDIWWLWRRRAWAEPSGSEGRNTPASGSSLEPGAGRDAAPGAQMGTGTRMATSQRTGHVG